MIRNLISLFAIVITLMLGLATYHLNSVNALPELLISFSHWEDTRGLTTIQDAMRTGTFKTAPKGRINFGYTESVHWFRFQLPADSLPKELAFEIRNHTIDYLELFEVKSGQVVSLGKTGSRLPFAQRPSPTKTFAYLLSIEAGQPVEYYLRLDKRHENLATELTLWRTDDFEDKEQREYFLWGFFTGVVGLIVLLALLFFVATRDPVYGFYGLFILALALRQFADTGLGFQYLWPELPAINQPDPVIQALWIYLPSMLLFQQYFLGLRTESKYVFWATQTLKYAFFCLFIGLVICQLTGFSETYTGANRLIRQIHTVMANTIFLSFIATIVVGLRANDTVKRLYAIGFGIQTICQLFVAAQNIVGNQRDGFFVVDTYLILMVIFFIDLVIFAYLLAYRYRKSMDEQRQLQLGLVQSQQHTNEAIIDVLESERQQVGNLILTDVGGRLTQTRTILSKLTPSPLLSDAVIMIDKTDACLDEILRDSLPLDLTQKGLTTALAELVEQRDQPGAIRLFFSHECEQPESRDLSDMQTRQLYRIANELINNIIKHAQATEGQVSLCQTRLGWQLIVTDNGQGFDTTHAKLEGGIGLKNLYARAQTLGATVQIESGEGGTKVLVVG